MGEGVSEGVAWVRAWLGTWVGAWECVGVVWVRVGEVG